MVRQFALVALVTLVLAILPTCLSAAEPAAAPAVAPATQPDVVAIVPAIPPAKEPDWFVRSRTPAPWLKWGADQRLRVEHYTNNALDEDALTSDTTYFRARTRLWGTLMPTPDKNVEINTRLAWEWRSYCEPEGFNSGANRGFRDTDMNEVIFDNLNVKLKDLFNLVDVTIGRQDIILGDGWLVLDGTPLDGSRTIFFDAARATFKFKDAKTTADLIYINQHADSDWMIEPFNHREYPLSNEDNQGAIIYVSNKSVKDTTIDGYFIYRHDEMASGHNSTNPILGPLKRGWDADIYTFGTRVEHGFDEHWKARGEIAGQFGNKNGRDLQALGFNSRVTYAFNDSHKQQLWWDFEYLSGDDGSSGKDTGFDILWGRWPQWSELYPVATALEGGRPAQYTNLYRVGPGWSCKPTDNTEFTLRYQLLFANHNPFAGTTGFSDDGKFRGQSGTALFRYVFNEHVAGHAIVEVFGPGDYYDKTRNDTAVFGRYEIVFTW